MEWEGLYDKAVQIATRAHAGQHDKAGEDYILHPLRVAERCESPKAKIVALLHDTIEDTDVTEEYLRQQEFPTTSSMPFFLSHGGKARTTRPISAALLPTP